MPMSASRGSSFGPTLVSSRTGRSASSRRERGLLNPHKIGVQRLAAVVELDFDVRKVELDVLAYAVGLVRGRVGPDEHGDDLAVVVDELLEQLAHGIRRRRSRRDEPVARQ